MARIDEICVQLMGSEKAASLSVIHEKIAVLNEIDQLSHIDVGRISGDLQSYDLQQNEKYERLSELKTVLDSYKKA